MAWLLSWFALVHVFIAACIMNPTRIKFVDVDIIDTVCDRTGCVKCAKCPDTATTCAKCPDCYPVDTIDSAFLTNRTLRSLNLEYRLTTLCEVESSYADMNQPFIRMVNGLVAVKIEMQYMDGRLIFQKVLADYTVYVYRGPLTCRWTSSLTNTSPNMLHVPANKVIVMRVAT